MAFWSAIARYVAVEKIKTMGQETLRHGQQVFAREMAQGKDQKQAAKIAAKAMTEHAAGRTRHLSRWAGRAGELARSKAGDMARTVRARLRRK